MGVGAAGVYAGVWVSSLRSSLAAIRREELWGGANGGGAILGRASNGGVTLAKALRRCLESSVPYIHMYTCIHARYVYIHSHLGKGLEALPGVLVPKVECAIGARSGESAVGWVEGDMVDSKDVLRTLAVALEGKVLGAVAVVHLARARAKQAALVGRQRRVPGTACTCMRVYACIRMYARVYACVFMCAWQRRVAGTGSRERRAEASGKRRAASGERASGERRRLASGDAW